MWRRLARRARPHAWPAAAGLALGLLALGPALARGFVLSYDMVFVPNPPIGSAELGLAGGPPRAVPSDLVVALAARIIPAEFVQKMILLGIFVVACSGAAALLAGRHASNAADQERPTLITGHPPGNAAHQERPTLITGHPPGNAAHQERPTPITGHPPGNAAHRFRPTRTGGPPGHAADQERPALITGHPARDAAGQDQHAPLAGSPARDAASRNRSGLIAPLVAGVCYAWNPFVAERLIMGQWALLLGYAGLPWVVREVCQNQGRIPARRLGGALIPAAVGGFAAMSISALAAVPAALCGRRPGRASGRRLVTVLSVILVLSLVWLIPSFVVPVHADPNGVDAFAARSDTPFGAIGSLLMLGGIWNAEAVPAGYGGWASAGWLVVVLLACVGYLAAARRQRICPGLGIAAVGGACLAALGLWAPTRAALSAAISFWPGFAILRDGQQFLAPLALAEAVGLGAGISWLLSTAGQAVAAGRPIAAPVRPANLVTAQAPDHAATLATIRATEPATDRDANRAAGPATDQDARTRAADRAARQRAGRAAGTRAAAAGPAAVIGVLILLAPVLLLPGLAWGAAGRLRAVPYPADWLRARQIIEQDRRPGSVLLLPWAQYRRYPWNNGEAVFDPWPRLLATTMIWNDALQVGSIAVAPESPEARKLGPLITSGRPMTAALRSAGVRYVVVDAGPLLGQHGPRLTSQAGLPGAQVVLASSDLILFRLPRRSG